VTTNSAIRFSSKVRNLCKAKLQRSALALQRGDWLALDLAPQALAGSRQSYAEHFPMPANHGKCRKYFEDWNSPEALAYSDAEDEALREADAMWVAFGAFVDSLPLPPVPPRPNLDDEREMVRAALAAEPENDTLISLSIWVETQAERLAERVRRTIEKSYLQLILDSTDRAIAAYLGIEPRKSTLLDVDNGKAFLREVGARD
jgi:hypothetical protein